jgi:hypothetical protein
MWTGLRPTRSNEVSICFRAELGHYFTLWAKSVRLQKKFGLLGPTLFGLKFDGPETYRPIPSTTLSYYKRWLEQG